MAARVYATVADYRAWSLDTFTPDPRVGVLLRQASAAVDRALLAAVYATDTNGYPTDTSIIDTLNQATCAQAAFINALSDDTGAAARMEATSIGGVSVRRAAGTAAMPLPPLGPAALEILTVASGLPGSPFVGW